MEYLVVVFITRHALGNQQKWLNEVEKFFQFRKNRKVYGSFIFLYNVWKSYTRKAKQIFRASMHQHLSLIEDWEIFTYFYWIDKLLKSIAYDLIVLRMSDFAGPVYISMYAEF